MSYFPSLAVLPKETPSPETIQHVERSPKDLAEPIETIAQFLEWYSNIENHLADGQDQEAHAFAELLRIRASQCGDMLECIMDVENLLDRMEVSYRKVCEQTEGVKLACANLGERRDRFSKLSDQIEEQLSVYNSLSHLSQLFNSPGDRVCLDPEFLPSLEKAESAIAFIEAHPSGKDSELFLMRFGQCRMRALSLIKMHALRVFKQLSIDMSTAFSQDGSSSRSAALFVKFRAQTATLAPLLHALQKRSQKSEAGSTECQILLDVQNSYFQSRRTWLRPYIQDHLKTITKEHEEVAAADPTSSTAPADVRIDSLRDWCAFVMNVCADEYRIYYDFFSATIDSSVDTTDAEVDKEKQEFTISTELRAYLDSVMTMFHEQVRPLIIHEPDVAVLAGLSLTLLTYHNSADNISSPSRISDEAASSSRQSISYAPVDNELDAFYAVVDQILQDTQQRLVYKAQSYIRSNISNYKISKTDAQAMARWVELCSQLKITDPEALVELVKQVAVTVDLQNEADRSSDDDLQTSTRASSSFVDVTTAAATATEENSTKDSNNVSPKRLAEECIGPSMDGISHEVASLLDKLPNGRMSAEDVEALQWIYPPVQSYRWLVSQVDGCLDYEVQRGVVEEALAACKQNLLNQGARFVREASIKSKDSGNRGAKQKDSASSVHAEQQAHLFVTYNLNSVEHVFL
ncbi:Golgi transport complex subunit 3 [Coemansia umbellata]|nr:Golgi transport complex subunit 3 [Coemansia umbellata]